MTEEAAAQVPLLAQRRLAFLRVTRLRLSARFTHPGLSTRHLNADSVLSLDNNNCCHSRSLAVKGMLPMRVMNVDAKKDWLKLAQIFEQLQGAGEGGARAARYLRWLASDPDPQETRLMRFVGMLASCLSDEFVLILLRGFTRLAAFSAG